MGEVVDLFTGKQKEIPAAAASDFVMEFSEGPLGDFLFALNGLLDAQDEPTFRDCMAELKLQVNEWPT